MHAHVRLAGLLPQAAVVVIVPPCGMATGRPAGVALPAAIYYIVVTHIKGPEPHTN